MPNSAALRARIRHWVDKLHVQPQLVRVAPMTRKWGSCSTRGTVTFAADLSSRPQEFQDFVIAHELLHLRVPNHGRLFKALMTLHVPNWRALEHMQARSTSRTAFERQAG